MSLLGNVLVGIGSYLINKGQIDEKKAEADLLYSREIALKQLEFQHDDKVAARNLSDRLTEIDETGNQQRLTDVTEGVVQGQRDQQKHGFDQQDIILKGKVDLAKDSQVEKLRQSGKLTEDAYQAGLDLQKQLRIAGVTIDHWATTNDGRLMAFNKLGKPLEQTQTSGGFTTPGANEDTGIPGIGGGKTTAAAQPTAQTYRNVKANAGVAPVTPGAPGPADTSDFAPRYNAATPETAPKLFRTDPATGQPVKIPLAEAMQMYRSAGSQ